jgi:Tol biopolymer transport system component
VGVAVVLALAAGAGLSRLWMPRPPAPANVQVQRLTDFVGVEEQPTVSPDGKWVAFIAPDKGRRQVWVRLLAGGAPASVTHDSRDGLHIVTFQSQGSKTVLVILSRDGSKLERVKRLASDFAFRSPRWSPDDHWIAFDGNQDVAFNHSVYVMNAGNGEPKAVASASNVRGVAWLPNGSGLVYASSAGSTVAYPPIFNLRTVSKDGGPERQLAFSDESYVEPDRVAAGKVFASRVRMQSDIWRFPVTGSAGDNTRNGVAITRPDRSGADSFGEPGRKGYRVPLRQRRARESVGGRGRPFQSASPDLF